MGEGANVSSVVKAGAALLWASPEHAALPGSSETWAVVYLSGQSAELLLCCFGGLTCTGANARVWFLHKILGSPFLALPSSPPHSLSSPQSLHFSVPWTRKMGFPSEFQLLRTQLQEKRGGESQAVHCLAGFFSLSLDSPSSSVDF